MSTPLGERVDIDGDIHCMHWAPAVAPLRSSIPVYLAALYPKMTEIAAQTADGLTLFVNVDYGDSSQAGSQEAFDHLVELGRI